MIEEHDTDALGSLLGGLHETSPELLGLPGGAASAPPQRDLTALMRRIPVALTLEVGEARLSLHELGQLGPDSVVELNTLAGEPLTLKVNGTPIGRAEVVVAGDNYGLRVLEIAGLDLQSLQP